MKHLEGKFFLEDCGEHFRTGEIIETSDEYVYLKYDVLRKTDCPVNQASLIMIANIADATMDDEGDIPAWSFFDSRKELDLYLNWLNEPSKKDEEPVVVPIRGH